jgi:hypothetical protein
VWGEIRLEYLSELRKSWDAILDFIQSLQANAEVISQRSVLSSDRKHSFVIAESSTQSAGMLVTQCLQNEIIIIIIIIILNKSYFDTLLLLTVWQSWNMYMNQMERSPKEKSKINCYGKVCRWVLFNFVLLIILLIEHTVICVAVENKIDYMKK